MKKGDLNAMHVVRPVVSVSLADFLGLYHKLHGVPRPVAMKKTVIKRRKRVPASGQQSGRGQSANDSGEIDSPATTSAPMPHTPATATIDGRPYNPSDPSHASPPFTAGTPTRSDSRGPSQPVTATADPLGLRRPLPPNKAIPLIIPNVLGGERKKPWWIEERREREKEDKEHEGMSVSLVGPLFDSWSIPASFISDPFITMPRRSVRLPFTLLSCHVFLSSHLACIVR